MNDWNVTLTKEDYDLAAEDAVLDFKWQQMMERLEPGYFDTYEVNTTKNEEWIYSRALQKMILASLRYMDEALDDKMEDLENLAEVERVRILRDVVTKIDRLIKEIKACV